MTAVEQAKTPIATHARFNFSLTSDIDLIALSQAVEDAKVARLKTLENNYGSTFCQNVGIERLLCIPQMSPEGLAELNKTADGEYPKSIEPSLLGDQSVVRGEMGVNITRPFVAIRLDLYDESHKLIDTIVELIFKRYCIHGDGKKGGSEQNRYSTIDNIIGTSKESYGSRIYGSGGFGDKNYEILNGLLSGQRVLSWDGRHFISVERK